MEEGLITCPKCGHKFQISDALTGQIREHMKVELQQEMEKKIENKLEEKYSQRFEDIEKSKVEKEKEIQTKQEELEKKHSSEVTELKSTLENLDNEIDNYRKQELDLRKEKRELEDNKKSVELEVARKVDEEREKIRQDTYDRVSEEHRLKDLEKDKRAKDLTDSLEEMKRKAEQGSMETQGEVLEQDFEKELKSFFPNDDIQPVPKGIRGADIVQKVRTPLSIECGILLWETKNTKSWSSQWIPKLKDDMTEIRAMFGILVSVVTPEEINRFGLMDGVWVSDPSSAIPLSVVLRQLLIAVNRERSVAVGKNEKMEALFHYLTGVEFSQKIEGIIEVFNSMENQLKQERRVMEKHWKQREKEIERVVKNTVGLYGDMQGILGGQIPAIPALEFDEESFKQIPDSSSSQSKLDLDKS